MNRVIRQRASKTSRNRALRPVAEGLEDRMLLYAVNGDVFSYGVRMAWSVMPDGTSLGGISSNLNATLNSDIGSESTWITAFQDAFAQWENIANVNFTQVSDNGAAFGSGAYQQGSPNFGDVRIGGLALPANELAFTVLPPAANGNSTAGDIFFNTNLNWNSTTGYDLETVALHEIGHVMGLGESTVTNAAMYPYYGGTQQWLASDDINGAQAIWGPRQEDPFVQNTDNLTMANAANVTGFMNPSSGQVYLPGLNVASSAQSYWFKFTTPANSSAVFTAQVQSSNLSELSPRVEIFNASGVGLMNTTAPANDYGATINATITNATPNTTYYVRVLGSNAGDTGTGAYTMTLNAGYGFIGIAPPPNTQVLAQGSLGGGSQLMSLGTVGDAIKASVLAGENHQPKTPGTPAAPSLLANTNSIAAELTTSGALTTSALDAALIGLFQDIPSTVLNGSMLLSTQSSAGIGTGSTSVGKLDSILTRYLDELDSIRS